MHQIESETLYIFFIVKAMQSQRFEYLSPVILALNRNKRVFLVNVKLTSSMKPMYPVFWNAQTDAVAYKLSLVKNFLALFI